MTKKQPQHSRSDRILTLTALMLALALLPWLGDFGVVFCQYGMNDI